VTALVEPVVAKPKITWGPICICGTPRIAHRHGTSAAGTHLSIPFPGGPRK